MTGKVYAATRTGKLHVNSEDSILIGGEVIASEDHDDCVNLMRKLPEQGFVCVADGVGGYTGGAIASNFVLLALAENEITQLEQLHPFLTRVHQNLLDYASSVPELHMMSTTMTGIFFYESKCYCVHAGNTRTYHYHGGYLEQLTTDHTVYQELLEQGHYYEALICNKNIITASFGGAPEMIHRLTVFECPPFETLLLTTDGIHDHLDHDELEEIMGRDEVESEKLERMICRAQNAGSMDDLSAVIIHCEDSD